MSHTFYWPLYKDLIWSCLLPQRRLDETFCLKFKPTWEIWTNKQTNKQTIKQKKPYNSIDRSLRTKEQSWKFVVCKREIKAKGVWIGLKDRQTFRFEWRRLLGVTSHFLDRRDAFYLFWHHLKNGMHSLEMYTLVMMPTWQAVCNWNFKCVWNNWIMKLMQFLV
jgi:hypothetical protein